MIGGPSDVVVETNIVRAAAAARPAKHRPRAQRRAEAVPRAHAAARSDALAVAARARARRRRCGSPGGARRARPRAPTTPGEICRGAGGPARSSAGAAFARVRPVRPADTLAGLADEFGRRPSPARSAARCSRSARRRVAAPRAAGSPAADQSLAEMAQRLEAALRRPMAQKVVTEATASRPPSKSRRRPKRQRRRTAEKQPATQPATATRQSRARNGQPFEQTRKDLTARGFAACVRLTTGVAIALLCSVPRTLKTSASTSARAPA